MYIELNLFLTVYDIRFIDKQQTNQTTEEL